VRWKWKERLRRQTRAMSTSSKRIIIFAIWDSLSQGFTLFLRLNFLCSLILYIIILTNYITRAYGDY
jgi:hypothetical protein